MWNQLIYIAIVYFRNSKYLRLIQIGFVLYFLLSQEPNYYQVLGINDISQLRQQYYKMSLSLHPDKSGSSEQYLNVKTAYETLKDEHLRLEHDISVVGHYSSIHQMVQAQITAILYYYFTLVLLMLFGGDSLLQLLFNFCVEMYLTTHHGLGLYWRTPAQIITFLRQCYFLSFATADSQKLTIANLEYWIQSHFKSVRGHILKRLKGDTSKLKQECIRYSHEQKYAEIIQSHKDRLKKVT